MLKCKFPICGPNFAYTGSKYNAQKAGNYTIPTNHPLFIYNKELGSTVLGKGTPCAAVDKCTPPFTAGQILGQGDSVLFSFTELESKINLFERNSTDPNAGTMVEKLIRCC